MEWRIIVLILCLIGVNSALTITTTIPTITNSTVNSTINITNSTTITPTTASAIAYRFALNFKINSIFLSDYANISSDASKALITNITSEVEPLYRAKYINFLRYSIISFSNGSIATKGELQFNSGSKPNETDLTQIFTDGNFTLAINKTTLSITDATPVATTVSPSTVSASFIDFNLTFKMNQVFTSDLSNISSNGATSLATNITTALNGVYKAFQNFNRTSVWQFRAGSVIVDALIQFNQNSTTPSALALARALADSVRNGTITLPIDPASIKVTDPSGTTANRSPVLSSMLTAVWMTLASLLLSTVMH